MLLWVNYFIVNASFIRLPAGRQVLARSFQNLRGKRNAVLFSGYYCNLCGW